MASARVRRCEHAKRLKKRRRGVDRKRFFSRAAAEQSKIENQVVFGIATGARWLFHRHATQYLTRWDFDWSKPGRFNVERLSDERCEYPRIDERRVGSSYRHGYLACIGGPGSDDIFHRGIGHFNHATGQMSVYSAGPRFAVAEPVFVPTREGSRESEGYLLTNIFNEDRNASHLAIFDAEQIENGPIPRVHLDHRVPVGFHGCWRAGGAF